MAKHLHITENGKTIGVVFVDHDGIVKGDGSAAADNAIHNMNHRGLKPEHGENLLHSIMEKLDRSTVVHGHICDGECLSGGWNIKKGRP